MYDITNCVPGEEVEVQVRAVIKSSNGATVGGEWSRTAIGRISLQPPSPPVGVYVDEQFILNWKSPATLGSPIDKYIVERIRMKSSSSVFFFFVLRTLIFSLGEIYFTIFL